MPLRRALIGTAAWNLPALLRSKFADGDSLLERYASRFTAVEINSSFYRAHLPSTYARWATVVPAPFRFAVKVPREVTHTRRLARCAEPLRTFISEVQHLGSRLGPLLVQLPPSLGFDEKRAHAFFSTMRRMHEGDVVCEPRHASWFAASVDVMLTDYRVARAATDPALDDTAARPGGWPELAYYRQHGSPKMYYSSYPQAAIETLAEHIAARPGRTWCIFDNTALGAATENALDLQDLLGQRATARRLRGEGKTSAHG